MTAQPSLFTLLFLCILSSLGMAQDNIRAYDFKAGEVLDILLLNQNSGIDSLLKVYFETAIPIAIKNGYAPNKGFSIREASLQGNYQPGAMVVASWPSTEIREKCLTELETKVAGFHQMRRAIWSHFNVTYYPLTEDLSFSVDMDRYVVATAYWKQEGQKINRFVNKWEALAKNHKGEIAVQLTNGETTFGYKYQPDYLIISTWPSAEAFEQFKAAQVKMSHKRVAQVHQFHIQ